MTSYPVKTCQFIINDLQIKTPPAEATYVLVGRSTPDVFTNKNILDPSNRVLASSINASGTSVAISGSGTTGDILTLTSPTTASFMAP
jgi:hypothetical protein